MSMSMRRIWPALLLCAVMMLAGAANAQRVLAADAERIDRYTTRHTDPQGKVVYRVMVPGSPPPAVLMKAAAIPVPDIQAGINSLTGVPAFNWIYGCSATAAAMLAGYYDQPAQGYTNIYSGPANGGVCPLNNEDWWANMAYAATCGTAVTCGNSPLSATRNNIDGRTTRGSVDDYWRAYNCTGDPYATGSWTEHAADCLADFMGTSQWVKYGSGYGNPDGSTSFWFAGGNEPLYDYTGMEPLSRDGCHGIRLFFESRGYSVTSNFNQRIYGFDGIAAGFTYARFKAEIDAGRPVLIHVYGHTMLGVGYNDSGSLIYVHDTWDHAVHSMAWGGTYYGMQHRSVTVVQLAPAPPPAAPTLSSPASGTSVAGTAVTLQWNATAGATQYRLEVNSNSSFSGTQVYSAVVSGTSQSVTLFSGSGNTFYWRVYAGNAAGRWSSPSQVWSFIYAGTGFLIGTYPTPSSSAGGIAPPAPAPAPPVPLPPPVVQVASLPASAKAPDTTDSVVDSILVFSITLLAIAFLIGLAIIWRRGQKGLF